MSDARDAGYDDFLDAVEEGDPFYLQGDGDGWLPPREFDPETGERGLSQEPLPETGEILTCTTTYVASPDFVDDAPFVVAVADFGPVQMTGQVRGVDPEDVEIGDEVTPAVDETETTGDRLLVFDPA
ncbi:Zn-ribbon domain-containing OB-fold protein [Halovenus marina]|uniref:Zn-ribbon domain-containing OB-fold protein n=1 Tax=Halovenus marina TaxID=3396621 RepID=UPI003F5644DF